MPVDDQSVGWIPKTVDEPPMILWWDIYTVMPVATLIFLGIMAKKFLFPIVGLGIYYLVVSRVKRKIPKGFFINLIYATGLVRFKGYPIFLQRRYWE